MSTEDFTRGREYELDLMKVWLEERIKRAHSEFIKAQKEEERTWDAMDSMERKYWEGREDALSDLLEKITERMAKGAEK